VAVFLTPHHILEAISAKEVKEIREHGFRKRVVAKTPISSIILDFAELTQAHTGEYLAEKLCNILKDYGIEKKVNPPLTTRPFFTNIRHRFCL
jgi:hypothetical protein